MPPLIHSDYVFPILAQWTQIQPDEDSRHSTISNHNDETPPVTGPTMKISLSKPIIFSPHGQRDPKRKKPDLRDVFNPDEDDTTTQVKKRKLVPLGIYLISKIMQQNTHGKLFFFFRLQ